MEPQVRKVTYKLYPNKTQAAALGNMLVLHQRLYNACLEERIRAYEWRKKIEAYRDLTDEEKDEFTTGSTYIGQCRGLTALRHELPEYKALPVKSLRTMPHRVD